MEATFKQRLATLQESERALLKLQANVHGHVYAIQEKIRDLKLKHSMGLAWAEVDSDRMSRTDRIELKAPLEP